MPGRNRATAEQAMLFLADIKQRLTLIALDADEYITALQAASAAGALGGAIYDALIASCALKAQAEALFTWNLRHYRRLWPDV